MAKKKESGFEENIQRLQNIVQELERSDLPLERNVALYKEGRALVASCREMLAKARHEISLSEENGEDVPFSIFQEDSKPDF